MKKWFILAGVTALISSMWSLSVKYGLEYYTPAELTPWYSLAATIFIIFYINNKGNKGIKKFFDFSIWGALAGTFSGISMIMLTKSIYESPNPGLSVALFRTQSIFTAILEAILFKDFLTFSKVAGMLVIMCGTIVILMSTTNNIMINEGMANITDKTIHITKKEQEDKEQEDKEQEDKEDKEKEDKIKKKGMWEKIKENELVLKYEWVIYALVAGLAMTIKDICSRKGMRVEGMKGFSKILWSTSAFQTTVLLLIMMTINKGKHVDMLESTREIPRYKKLFRLLLPGVIFAIYQYSLLTTASIAPNVGLVKAIVGCGILFTTVLSVYLFKSELNEKEIAGLMLIISGVFGLAHTTKSN